jgi:hypothetical protein
MLLEARGARHTGVEEEPGSEEPKGSPIEGGEVHKPRRQRWVTYRTVLLTAGALVMLLGGRDQAGTSTPIPVTPTPALAVTAPPVPTLTSRPTPAFAPSPTPNPTLMSLYDDFNGPIIDESKWILPDNKNLIYQANGVLNL